jgi:hypothetical protein
MTSKAKIATLTLAFALFGCKGTVQTSAASAGDSTGSGSSGESATSGGGTRTENIVDPTMDNKTAFYITIPANWKFQGILMQGGVDACDSGFSGVFRATSEDGQSFGEALPQLVWAYGDGPRPKAGCLPLDKPMSARDFLEYLSITMRVGYIGDAPIPDGLAKAVKQWKDSFAQPPNPFYAAHNLRPPHGTADGAAATVRYNRNGVSMEGRLDVLLYCTEAPPPGFQSTLAGMPSKPGTISGKCTASASYVTAPENQFAAVLRRWDDPAIGGKQNKEWGDAWMKRYAAQRAASEQQFEHNVNQLNKTYLDTSNRNFQAQQEGYRRQAAVQQQMHNEFMDAMQQGTDRSMQRTADAMQARSTSTSDWVDYALDRQTVRDVNTGQTGKISNQVTPGGTLQKVHGDGTPY